MRNTKKNTNLINARKKIGLTQEELAKKVGYKGKQAIANLENGHSSPPLEKAFKIAEVLNEDVYFLFGIKAQDSHTKTTA